MGQALALVGGNVVTMNVAGEVAEALLLEDGLVSMVGTSAQVRAAAGNARVLDLAGRTVVPGLIDAHTHVEFCALSRRHWLDVRGVSREITLQRVADAVANGDLTAGWLVAQGTYGQDLPLRTDLDAVAPGVPVLVRESMHRLVASTEALTRAGMTRGYTSPVGTRVEIGPDGAPSGLVEEGYHLFPVPLLEEEQLAELLREEIIHSFARHGVTTIYELPATAGGVRAYQRLHRQGRLPGRLSLNLTVAPGLNPLLDSVDTWAGLGLTTGFGDDQLWLGAAKVFLDGDDTASYDRNHLGKSASQWGTMTRQFAQVVELLVSAGRAGIHVWVHAIGDAAQEIALDAFAEARRVVGDDAFYRMEHVANLWCDAQLLDRLAQLRVIPVPTAAFLHSDPGTGAYAYRSLVARGLRPPGNSDTGGTQPFATNPWFGVAAMIERTNQHGVVIAAEESVDVETAVRTYTTFAAEAGGREGRIGVLSRGAAGDCVVLPLDPFAGTPAELRSLEADITIAAGQAIWDPHGELA